MPNIIKRMEKDLSIADEFTRLHGKYNFSSKINKILDVDMDAFCVTDTLSRGNIKDKGNEKY